MKKLITFIIVAALALTIQAQDITNTLDTLGSFYINDENDNEIIKIDAAGTFHFKNEVEGSSTQFDVYNYGHNLKMNFLKASGTPASPTTVVNLSTLGIMYFQGYTGLAFLKGASISAQVSGTPSSTDLPTNLTFATRETNQIITRMTIKPDGSINIPDLDIDANAYVLVDADGDLYSASLTYGINDLTDGKTGSSSLFLGTIPSGLTGTAEQNTVIGINAGSALTDGKKNILIGKDAGIGITTGNDNIDLSIGGAGITTGDGNIVIGKYPISVASGSADNQMNIGNTIYATGMYTSAVKVGIGEGNHAPSSTLDVDGSVSLALSSGTADYTLTASDFTYLTNNSVANDADVTLPTASGISGRVYIIKNTGSGSQNVIPNGSENIDGSNTNHALASLKFIKVQSDGTNWWIIGQN